MHSASSFLYATNKFSFRAKYQFFLVILSEVEGSSVAKRKKQDMRLTARCFGRLNMTIWKILNFTA